MIENLSKIKVCFITGDLGQGGAERQLYYIVKTLKSLGTEVLVLSPTHGKIWEKRIKQLGVNVKWIGKSQYKLVRMINVLLEVRKNCPDIVQSQFFHTNLYSSIAAQVLNKCGLGAIRNDTSSEIRDTGRLGKLCFIMPKVLVANSKAAIESAVQLGRNRSDLYYLPNAIDTEYFLPNRMNEKNTFNIVAIGRLVNQKGYDRMLKIISKCVKSRGNIRLRIYGQGPLQAKLEERAEKMGLLGKTVNFMGTLDDIRPAFHTSDLLLLTSNYEGTPNVAMEALACGIPVVSTRVGGVEDVVLNGETGKIYEVNDENGIVQGILSLVEERENLKIMGQNGRNYIEKNYSLNLLPQKLNQLYTSVLGTK